MSPVFRTGIRIISLALVLGSSASMADVVAVVSVKSPVNTVSKDQIADIFLGKTRRFPGGLEAIPIDLAEGSALSDEFYRQFTGKSPAQIKSHWSRLIFTGRGYPPKEMPDGAQVKKMLAEDLRMIGYIDSSMVDDTVRVVAPH